MFSAGDLRIGGCGVFPVLLGTGRSSLPQPDYALQALISFIGCGLVLLAGGITGVVADKQPAERKRVVITGCLTIMGIGVLTTVAALTIPAI